jgi:hypothetical protein
MTRPASPSPSRSTHALVLVAALVVTVLWVVVTHPFEGPVVYEISEDHGIHRYDFLGVVPPLMAVWWSMKAARRR